MLNIFKKKNKDGEKEKKSSSDLGEAMKNVDTSKMGMKEKMAFKMFQKMPKKKQEEVMRKAMNPQNILKEKDKILKQLKEAVDSGEMSKQEAEQIKSRLGLR
ncbi:MAG: hypothetical protein PF549_03400 [Patescibacteria group bacterium]|jgi:hypothetical protein|nr:hypothetical protein [Patescibacteria group bacterium]